MNIRRALTFAWRMALAYLQVTFSLALMLAGIVGLCLLAITIITLMTNSAINLFDIFVIIAYIATSVLVIVPCLLVGVGFILNTIGVAIGMLFAPQELDLKDLRVSVPQNLLRYNMLGLPLLLLVLGGLAGHLLGTILPAMFLFVLSLIPSGISQRAWKKVVNWYELSGQGITKKKNIPTIEKSKIKATETNDTEMYAVEEDVARLRKSR